IAWQSDVDDDDGLSRHQPPFLACASSRLYCPASVCAFCLRFCLARLRSGDVSNVRPPHSAPLVVRSGSDLVDWLYAHIEGFTDRRDVRRYASNLLKYGFIQHTVNKSTFSEQCYYVFTDMNSTKKTLKLNQKRETRVELENAYAEIDRLRRLLSCSVLPQQSADLGNGGEGFGQRNRCRTTKNAQNDKFQNARLTALTKAIRALHREKEAVSQLNNELLRQLQKCKQCCPKTERTGRRRPSGNSLPAGTVIATPINAPKADAATERGTNHREDRSPVEPYIDAVEADDMQIRFGDLERRNQYLEKQKQELEASYSNML
ncbi:unnamed protein product, partial [Dibothriocephalus latus]